MGRSMSYQSLVSVGPTAKLTAPVNGDFSWDNQGGASVDVTGGGITLIAPASGSGAMLRVRYKTAPSPPYTITVALLPFVFRKQWHSAGVLWRQSSDGKIIVFDQVTDATSPILRVSKFTSSTSFSADYQTERIGQEIRFFQFSDDNTSRIARYSHDGQHWRVFHSIGRTDFLTADQIGFEVGAENVATPNLDAMATILSWAEGA